MTDFVYSYDELNGALRQFRRESESVTNTCYYFPAELKEKIDKGVITYDIKNDSIVVYEHSQDFDSVMFCINENTEKIFVDEDKSKLIDIVYSELHPVEKYVDRVLKNSGFSFLSRAYCMVLTDFDFADNFSVNGNILFATEEMADDIVRLWRTVFDPDEVYIQSVDEVKKKIAENQIVVCIDETGNIAGAVASDLNNKENAMIRHVAVSEKARGKGIGSEMCCFYLREREKIGFSKATLWVEDYRQSAIKLYEKIGFKRNGKEMLRYVKK